MQSLQPTVNDNSEEQDPDRALLDTQLRTTRTQLPPRQEPHVVAPPVYLPQENSITPFAHPATLNASVAMGAVMGTNNNQGPRCPINAPFRMMMPELPANPPTRPVRKVFRSKCYCATCGWRKKEHTVGEGRRRGMKPEHCSRQFCGNCYNMKEHHEKEGIPFGKDCTDKTNAYCFDNVNHWWVYKVCFDGSAASSSCYKY
jgi:hypothetical protein